MFGLQSGTLLYNISATYHLADTQADCGVAVDRGREAADGLHRANVNVEFAPYL